jgi:hypothetical protein
MHARALLTASIAASVFFASPACKRKLPQASNAKLPFEDDFDRAEIGPNWLVTGGQWKIDAGSLYTTGANNAPLFLNLDLPADLALEVDVFSESSIVDSKIELMTDGLHHQSGYIFILGGWSNQLSVIARLDEHGADRRVRQPTGVVGKHWYRWRIEKKSGQLFWFIDGVAYMEFSDPSPLDGPGHNRLAFSNWQNQIRYDNLEIWPLAEAPPITARAVKTASAARTATP